MQDARDTPADSPHWPTIEADYRAGIKSLRQMAGEHGLSEGAIRKRARRDDWPRDLSAKIQAVAEKKVRMEAVRADGNMRTRVPESVVIEANATTVYEVQIAHRKGLTKLATLRDRLLAELEAKPVPAKQGEKAPETHNLPVRIESLKKLAEVDEKIRKGEREAYGIDKIVPDEGGIVSTLSEAERASRVAALIEMAKQRRTAEAPGAA